MSNIFILIENLLDIINNKHSLIMCAKYYNFSMNDACTICLADIVGLPAKVIWLTTFVLKKKTIFIWLLCWPLASQLRSQLMKCIYNMTSRMNIYLRYIYIYIYIFIYIYIYIYI